MNKRARIINFVRKIICHEIDVVFGGKVLSVLQFQFPKQNTQDDLPVDPGQFMNLLDKGFRINGVVCLHRVQLLIEDLS